MIRKIKDMKTGESAVIDGYDKEHPVYRERLLSMGLTRGTSFTLTALAPMGDPVEIEIRNFKLTLRAKEADILILKGDSDE